MDNLGLFVDYRIFSTIPDFYAIFDNTNVSMKKWIVLKRARALHSSFISERVSASESAQVSKQVGFTLYNTIHRVNHVSLSLFGLPTHYHALR